jgi:hypothetical protein
LTWLAGVAFTVSCGGGSLAGPNPGGGNSLALGTFHVLVTGIVTDTLDGPARFEIYVATNTCTVILDGTSSPNGLSIFTGARRFGLS